MSQELKNRLAHFSATPPTGTWEAIARSLDNQIDFDAQRLRDYEEVPAIRNWKNISESLPAAAKPVAPAVLHRMPRLAKLAIAAVVLGLLAFGIIQLMNDRPLADQSPIGAARQIPSGIGTSEQIGDGGDTPSALKEDDEPASVAKSFPATTEPVKVATEARLRRSRYVTINNDEGKTVRLSKKAYTLMACAENSTAINHNDCKESIQMMQQKVSASLISTSGDFSGLVDMVRSLEEQNELP